MFGIKKLIMGLIIGLLVGLWAGVNIGYDHRTPLRRQR